MTHSLEAQLESCRSLAAHDLTTARAKHRRATDKAVAELRSAIDALEGDTVHPDIALQFIRFAIGDLLKAKP